MAVALECDRVKLRLPRTEDTDLLYQWRNDLTDLGLWYPRRHPIDRESFREELTRFEQEHVHIRLMIDCNGEIVGTVYSYDANLVHGWTYIAIFVDKNHRMLRAAVAPIAWGLLVEYLFKSFPFRKIYAEAYSFNKISLKTLKSAGLKLEAQIPQHFYWQGEHHDQYIFALYREDSPNIISKFLDKRR